MAPEGALYHHDWDWDDDGHMYILGHPIVVTEQEKAQSLIFKYVDKTGELVGTADFSALYQDSSVTYDSTPNDVHFNTMHYVKAWDQLVVNSRNTSNFMGLDKNTFEPLWSVDDPAFKLLLPDKTLKAVNPDEFVYACGEHTTFVTDNVKYQELVGPDKLVFSIFDNVSCKDENFVNIEKPEQDPEHEDEIGYLWDSAVQVVAIDLKNFTVEQLDRFTVPGERSRITSSVYDTADGKYFQAYYGVPADFFIIDTNGKVGVAIKGVKLPDYYYTYRGRVFSFDEIRSLVPKKI